MKRALFAMVVAVSIGMMGCAADGVDDSIPPTPAPEPQRDPPPQTLSGQLRDPQAQLISVIAINRGLEEVAPRQKPPGPEPVPEPPTK